MIDAPLTTTVLRTVSRLLLGVERFARRLRALGQELFWRTSLVQRAFGPPPPVPETMIVFFADEGQAWISTSRPSLRCALQLHPFASIVHEEPSGPALGICARIPLMSLPGVLTEGLRP